MLVRLFIKPGKAVNVILESSAVAKLTPEFAMVGRPVYVHVTPCTGVNAASGMLKDAGLLIALTNNTMSLLHHREMFLAKHPTGCAKLALASLERYGVALGSILLCRSGSCGALRSGSGRFGILGRDILGQLGRRSRRLDLLRRRAKLGNGGGELSIHVCSSRDSGSLQFLLEGH